MSKVSCFYIACAIFLIPGWALAGAAPEIDMGSAGIVVSILSAGALLLYDKKINSDLYSGPIDKRFKE